MGRFGRRTKIDGKGHRTLGQEKHWSRIASNFEERTAYVAGRKNLEEIRRRLSALALSGRVLELGCGNGTYTRVLAETAGSVVATDLSEDMVATAREHLQDLPTVQVEQQDAFALSYPDATFDAVVMVNLLHVIPDRDKAVAESRRVVKPDGQIVVVSFTTAGMGLFAKLGLLYRYRRAFGQRPKTARALTVDETRAIVETSRFEVRDARLIGTGCKAVFLHAAAH